MKKNKSPGVLFLDMDGVLCTRRAFLASGGEGVWRMLDPISIQMIKNLCDEYNVRIVATSTWRNFGDEHCSMKTILETHGLTSKYFWHDWKTPDLRSTFQGKTKRGVEINKWLSKKPHVTRFIIFDDEEFDFAAEGLLKRLIKTDENDGILTKHYDAACKKLYGMD